MSTKYTRTEQVGSDLLLIANDDSTVATIHGRDAEQTRQRGNFLTQACNGHDAMLAALRAVHFDVGRSDFANDTVRRVYIRKYVDEAIVKATQS